MCKIYVIITYKHSIYYIACKYNKPLYHLGHKKKTKLVELKKKKQFHTINAVDTNALVKNGKHLANENILYIVIYIIAFIDGYFFFSYYLMLKTKIN